MGVHLEEPSSPTGQWDGDLDEFVRQLTNPSIQPMSVQQSENKHRHCGSEIHESELSREMKSKCAVQLSMTERRERRERREREEKEVVDSGHRKLGKTKSKHIDNSRGRPGIIDNSRDRHGVVEIDEAVEVSVGSNCDEDECREYETENTQCQYRSPGNGGTKVVFNCDSTPENSDSENGPKSPGRESSAQHRKDKDSKKRRFRKLITRPLRRSHSAGCEKDIPGHALFLQYNMEKTPVETLETRAATSLALYHQGLEAETEEDRRPAQRVVHKTCSADATMMTEDLAQAQGSAQTKSKSRNLARNVKRKLQFLRRRNTDSALGAALVRSEGKVTPEQALSWSRSFESLLGDKNGLDLFRGFLRSEFSEENLEFWIACEDFKGSKTAKLPAKAQKIYSDFVAVQAPKEINLDSKTRVQTISHLVNPTKDAFEMAQKRIQALMEKDSYPRFIQSEIYQQLVSPPETSS